MLDGVNFSASLSSVVLSVVSTSRKLIVERQVKFVLVVALKRGKKICQSVFMRVKIAATQQIEMSQPLKSSSIEGVQPSGRRSRCKSKG